MQSCSLAGFMTIFCRKTCQTIAHWLSINSGLTAISANKAKCGQAFTESNLSADFCYCITCQHPVNLKWAYISLCNDSPLLFSEFLNVQHTLPLLLIMITGRLCGGTLVDSLKPRKLNLDEQIYLNHSCYICNTQGAKNILFPVLSSHTTIFIIFVLVCDYSC